jgi:hypothetical protein
MTDLTNDLPEQVVTTQENDAVPVLITFALLFLLSAAVWFVLDRIRADEVRTELSQRATHSQTASATRVQPSKVAAAE